MRKCERDDSESGGGRPVLVVGPLPPPLNGMTVMTAYALGALTGGGIHHVHLDTSDHRGASNVGRFDLRNVWLALRHWRGMIRTVRSTAPRLVYLPIAQGTLGFLRDALLFSVAGSARAPVVVHLHGAAFGRFYVRSGKVMKAIIRRCLGQAVCAIVLEESLRSVFSGLIDPAKVMVVRNGVPLQAPFLESPAPSHSANLLFLSNLSVAKGYLDVIEAASLVLPRHPRARLHIAGEWPSRSERMRVLTDIRRRGLTERISFYGPVSGLRKWELYRQCDVFVFPPRQLEGQPVVILEAMSHALPVVATSQGGIADVVMHEDTGLLVPAGDPQSLAIAVDRLLGDESLRTRMGRAGRERYAASFAMDTFQRRLADTMVGALRRTEPWQVQAEAP